MLPQDPGAGLSQTPILRLCDETAGSAREGTISQPAHLYTLQRGYCTGDIQLDDGQTAQRPFLQTYSTPSTVIVTVTCST